MLRNAAVLVAAVVWLGGCTGSADVEPAARAAGPNARATGMFDGSAVWTGYVRVYQGIREAGDAAALERQRSRADDLERRLETEVADATHRSDLTLLLRSELERRRSQLRRTRGKPPAPDYFEDLRESVPRLGAERRLLETAADGHLDEPWVRGTLLPSFRFSITLVQSNLELAEKQARRRGAAYRDDEEAIVREGETELERCRALEARLPAP